MRARLRALLGAVVGIALVLTAAPALGATTPKASLTDIENDVMCVSCRESLAVAQSPQSYAERGFIRTLIARGLTKQQIEQALVAQYGPAVLGKPPAHGFNLTVYVLPPAVLAIGLAILAVVLPRWRRRSLQAAARAAPTAANGHRPLDPGDLRRLEEDLARHG